MDARLRLSINLASVANPVDTNDPNDVGYFVNYSIVSNADPPVSILASQFSGSGRPRVVSKRPNSLDYSIMHPAGQPLEIAFCAAFKKNAIHDVFFRVLRCTLQVADS
jgi:hypothetical protein